MSTILLDLLTNMRRDGEEEEEEGVERGIQEEEEGEDRVPELTGIPPQLQHLAKNRPRRPKRHASSGALGQVDTVGTLFVPLGKLELQSLFPSPPLPTPLPTLDSPFPSLPLTTP